MSRPDIFAFAADDLADDDAAIDVADLQIGNYRLLYGDCLQRMFEFPEGSVDAVVIDPPYCSGGISESQRTRANGQGLRSETLGRFGWFVGDNMGTAGLVWLLRSVAIEARRIAKPTGSLLIFCDWRMQSSLQPAIESAGLRYQGLIVWDKETMGLGAGFRCQHELVLHFTFGSPEYHDLGVPNVIRCRRTARSEREHQTQKPVELMERLVRVVAPPGGVVCDCFMGSGATGVACVHEGRGFVGIENDPDCFLVAARHVSRAVRLASPFLAPAEAPR